MSKFKTGAAVLGLCAFILAVGALRAAQGPKRLGAFTEMKTTPTAVELTFTGGKMRVSARGDGALHLQVSPRFSFAGGRSFAVAEGADFAPGAEDKGESIVLTGGQLSAAVHKADGHLEFTGAAGALFSEPDEGGAAFQGDTVTWSALLPAGAHYYGFGEKTGPLDKRGTRMTMWNTDIGWETNTDPLYQSHPFYLTVREGRAHGVFHDNTFKTHFDIGASQPGILKYTTAGGELDFWVIAGPQPADVLRRYGELVGAMPLPPLWGLGYHQSRWSYKSEKEIRELADNFKKNDFPLDAVYLDIHYMDGYRVFTFDRNRFPDPGTMIADLDRDGVKTVVIVDPGIKVDTNYTPYIQALGEGYYVRDASGEPFHADVWPGKVVYPDFYREDVRKWWAGLHSFYTDLGVAGIWNDMNEPAGWLGLKDQILTLGRGTVKFERMVHGRPPEMVPHARVHNAYATYEAAATYDGLTRLRPNARPFIITRAGSPGIAKHALMWTGDNSSTWGHLAVSLPMGLNLGLSGYAFNGADIGGFNGSPTDELFARWVEAGAFYPFCRNHNSQNMPDQEPWAFGPDILKIAREAVRLRYRLLPYTYSLFEESSRTNAPVARAMVFEFPADEKVANLADQFMWGPWLLVAPVVEKGRVTREVYLPDGGWYNFFTGLEFEGGKVISVEAPPGKLPLFARAGAIIPLAPAMNHTGEKPWDPLTLMVFPGETVSSFSLYEDDFQSMDYKKGVYSRRLITARPLDGGIQIDIAKREGAFVPSRKLIELRVSGLGPDYKVTLESGGAPCRCPAAFVRENGQWLIEVEDSGEPVTIKIVR